MSVVRYRRLACPRCGEGVECTWHQSVYVARVPQAREKLLAGQLHKQTCLHCGDVFQIDERFFYFDSERKVALLVLPEAYEAHTQDLEVEAKGAAQLRAMLTLLQDRSNLDVADIRCGVVAGMDNARERILVWEANLDWHEVVRRKQALPHAPAQPPALTLLRIEGGSLYYARRNATLRDGAPLVYELSAASG